jgi:hypothetical protein
VRNSKIHKEEEREGEEERGLHVKRVRERGRRKVRYSAVLTSSKYSCQLEV